MFVVRPLVIGSLALAITAAAASGQPVPDRTTRIVRATGAPLTPASNDSPAAIVARYLRMRGHSDATVASLALVTSGRSARGITHLRFEQRTGDLPVHGVNVKASLNSRGELVSLIENLVAMPSASAVAPAIDERGALRAALAHLYGAVPPPGIAGREGPTTVFERTAFFHRGPRVTPVAVPRGDGLLGTAYLVETWTARRNLLHHTLVGGGGAVLGVELRTNNDSYNVFAVDPGVSAQTVVSGPGAGNAESPSGWLSGAQTTTNIAGNNVHAYLDADANNVPDGGGTPVTDGNFVAGADLSVSPADGANRAVAVQNLFYLNNVIHDTLYRHGFDEAAGNFQEDNFGLGGEASDAVNAEAQDGSGTDNANFATPLDGSNPRMQMFLWNPLGTHEVAVGGNSYLAQGAAFGPDFDTTGVSGPLALASNGTDTLACMRLPRGALDGAVAVVDRGDCTFKDKVTYAQRAGAIGVIIVNNADGALFAPGGTDGGVRIPAVLVTQADGAAIKAAAGQQATVRLRADAPPMRDAALDSDVVWHEYGHGLTWRMIGGMSGPVAGALGEGMSDVLAILVNGNDVVGEYSSSDPAGIRSAPYASYPRTYGDFDDDGTVHSNGEIYGAIGWRLRQNYLAAGLTVDDLLSDLVDGMNYTPSTPLFEDMRDGVLAAAEAGRDCLVWDAFAAYGVGDGASAAVSRRGTVTVVESFALPAGCAAPLTTANAND
jgi:hypothetical protein